MDDEKVVVSLDIVRGKKRKADVGCVHHHYDIDEEAGLVFCSRCEQQISPFEALLDFAKAENRFKWRLAELKEQEKKMEFKFANKVRTKCQHCQKFTKVNLR